MVEALLILVTLLLIGFFSGSETAFNSANKLRLEIASRRKDFTARSIDFFIHKPEALLTTTLAGGILVSVLFALFTVLFLDTAIQGFSQKWFGVLPQGGWLILIQIMLATFIITIFGEIVPRAVFRAKADDAVTLIAAPLHLLYYVLKPFTALVIAASNRIIGKSGNNNQDSVEKFFQKQGAELYSREWRENGGEGNPDEEDSAILQNVIELSNKRVKDSMIPRIEIEAVEKDTPIKDVLAMFIETGLSKLPVYRETIDDVIGVVYAYDFFHNPASLHEIIRPVKLVPSSKKSKDLLAEFRQSKMSVAIVLDEYGGTAGMVTIEDLLEEVVGDIQDEYDVDDEIINKLNENTFVISGNVVIEELVEDYSEIDIPLEPSQYDTVAGFIINHLGRIPKVNEEVLIEDKKFIISKATPSRIEKVKLILQD